MFGTSKKIKRLEDRVASLEDENAELRFKLEAKKAEKKGKWWTFVIPRTGIGDEYNTADAENLSNAVNYLTSRGLDYDNIEWEYKKPVILVKYYSEVEYTEKLYKIVRLIEEEG